MDDKFVPISPDSPFGQMMEKLKGLDISNLAPAYPIFDCEVINQQM